MSKIKICGLARREDIDAVNEALPDYIGFVFAPSPRQVSAAQATELKKSLDSRIHSVGVFVDAAVEAIAALVRNGVIDTVQLHGSEDALYIRKLKAAVNVPVFKAVRVQSAQQITQAQESGCDYLLLDAWHKGKLGGSGTAFDWALIPKLEKPYFLAGGLSAANLLETARYQPYGLDVSSGAETEGKKDRNKILELVHLIRRQHN